MAPADWLLGLFGTSSSDHHPTLMLVSMAATMTVPMVAWMRYRGHAWRINIEMAASMLIPTLGALTLVWTGAASGNAVMVPEHAAMLAGMLLAMLFRIDEYAAHHGHRAAQQALTA
jgi:glucose-6-phosphate-specific signal transduction histidine kinase